MPRLYGELRGLMTANDYTVPQLARVAGIRQTAMSRRLNGHDAFTLDEAYKILKLFHVPAARLHEIFPPDGVKEVLQHDKAAYP